jgi:hypothetical protein
MESITLIDPKGRLGKRFDYYRDVTPICPRAAALPLSSPREKTREKKTSGVSALVHATPGVTASRFAGRSANRTTPITRNTITSVKFRGTP